MKKWVIGIVSFSALTVMGVAVADTAMDASNETFTNTAAGLYVNSGLGWGYVFQNNEGYTNRNGLSWDALIGYQFNPYVALEGSYISFGHANATTPIGGQTESVYGFGVDVKGIYPVSKKWDVFGTAGVILLEQSISGVGSGSSSAWTPDLGLGADYSITRSIGLTMQDIFAFRNASQNVPAANAMILGMSYKFAF